MLKTNCDKCQFIGKNSDCTLLKPVFIDNNIQFSEGFCRYKRAGKEVSLKSIQDEESNLTAILICSDSDSYADILISLTSIGNNEGIKQLILSSKSIHKDKIDYIVDFIKQNIKIDWSIDIISEDIEMSYDNKMDYSCRLVKNNWFMPIKSGQKLNEDVIRAFHWYIREFDNNFISIYHDNISNNSIINKYAFIEMEGNLDCSWPQKVKTFDNWNKLCIKV
jgi:hypothetical protein